jgi:hypothetical protein
MNFFRTLRASSTIWMQFGMEDHALPLSSCEIYQNLCIESHNTSLKGVMQKHDMQLL